MLNRIYRCRAVTQWSADKDIFILGGAPHFSMAKGPITQLLVDTDPVPSIQFSGLQGLANTIEFHGLGMGRHPRNIGRVIREGFACYSLQSWATVCAGDEIKANTINVKQRRDRWLAGFAVSKSSTEDGWHRVIGVKN